MFTTRRFSNAITLVALATSGCATAQRSSTIDAGAPGGDDGHARSSVPGSIVATQLARVDGTSALDAVRQLRPDFLHATERRTSVSGVTPQASVYENDRYAGGLDVLNLIPMRVVLEIRRVEAVEAKSRFGSTCPCDGGVILVRTQP